MGQFKSYKKESRTNWGTEAEGGLTIEQIQLGAVLRIADSLETMAQRYDQLIRDRDYYKNRTERLNEDNDHLRRSKAALQGVITRKKHAFEELKQLAHPSAEALSDGERLTHMIQLINKL